MRSDRLRGLALALALIVGLGTACGRKDAGTAIAVSPLYTGKEPKRSVNLVLPNAQQTGFVTVKRDIYATASQVNQAKQVVLALMAGPRADGSEASVVGCFGAEAQLAELYLDTKGLVVVDLPAATVAALPGGTSAEVSTLFCLLKTLSTNVPGVNKMQVLIDGQVPESLRGHVDLQDSLTLGDF